MRNPHTPQAPSCPPGRIGSYLVLNDPEYSVRVTFDGVVDEESRAAADAFAVALPAGKLVRRSPHARV